MLNVIIAVCLGLLALYVLGIGILVVRYLLLRRQELTTEPVLTPAPKPAPKLGRGIAAVYVGPCLVGELAGWVWCGGVWWTVKTETSESVWPACSCELRAPGYPTARRA